MSERARLAIVRQLLGVASASGGFEYEPLMESVALRVSLSGLGLSTAGVVASSIIAVGPSPAATGAIRLSNGATADTGFIQSMTTGGVTVHVLSVNASDLMGFGNATIPTAIRTSGGTPTLGNNGWWWVESNDGTISGTSAAFFSRFGGVVRLLTPAVRATGRATAQAGANASVSTFTVGSADASFAVSANVLVTTATTHTFNVECAYTDEGNTARTVILPFRLVGDTTALTSSVTNTNGAVPYHGVPVHIRAKAATTITVRTQAAGTYTTVAYNVEGVIQQIA